MFLIFDTETTGLPKKWNAPLSDSENWPRCVQIAWQIHDFSGECIENRSFLIKPEGYTIPYEAEKMKSTLIKVGLDIKVKQFEESLNSAAEEASKFAKEIFITAVKNMAITDAFKILKGEDNAATMYLKKQTSKELYKKFKPVVKKAIDKVHVTKYWGQLSGRYNALPMTNKVNLDIEDYVTNKTIDGLFVLIAKEEKNIRNNPDARVSELLQKVFK